MIYKLIYTNLNILFIFLDSVDLNLLMSKKNLTYLLYSENFM
jgi:hypothetical protein